MDANTSAALRWRSSLSSDKQGGKAARQTGPEKGTKPKIKITRYAAPRGFLLAVFIATSTTFIVFSTRANLQPHGYGTTTTAGTITTSSASSSPTLVYQYLVRFAPLWFQRFCYAIQPFLFWPMVAIHLAEAAWMARTRMGGFGVRWWERVWWLWVGSAFIEGMGSFLRFDEMVRELEEEAGREVKEGER